ncbi:MAG TPA: KH domain-containing protein [Thermoleophilia bacterium]|nr:KH domain-containing protein [Thermoleophilia bacterium]
MKTLLEYLARRLVSRPEDVRVEEVEKDGMTVLRLSVAQEDLGKVIGRQGRIAHALRTVVKASAVKEDRRVTVEILD